MIKDVKWLAKIKGLISRRSRIWLRLILVSQSRTTWLHRLSHKLPSAQVSQLPLISAPTWSFCSSAVWLTAPWRTARPRWNKSVKSFLVNFFLKLFIVQVTTKIIGTRILLSALWEMYFPVHMPAHLPSQPKLGWELGLFYFRKSEFHTSSWSPWVAFWFGFYFYLFFRGKYKLGSCPKVYQLFTLHLCRHFFQLLLKGKKTFYQMFYLWQLPPIC